MAVVASDPDVVVVGAGPNGLTAAVVLAMAGRRVLVVEAAPTPGGGTRSAELTLPGFVHDVCSAIHPLGLASPALRSLPLADHGLRWVHPDVPLAHVVDGEAPAILHRSVEDTADGLGPEDGPVWRALFGSLVDAGTALSDGLLSPLAIPPRHPVALARFGPPGILSASRLGRRFASARGSGLFAGLAAHSILSLRAPATAGYGLMLGMLAHRVGWPMAEGGSQRIADALVSLLAAHGGSVECGREVRSLAELPSTATVLLDLTPRQVIAIAGDRLPDRYRGRLARFRYGPGVHKVDWALDGPVPWTDPAVAGAGTVHLGGSLAEVAAGEEDVMQGRHPERPFVLLAQPSRFDPSRAPDGRHTVWAYCHVPAGSTVDMTDRIEDRIEAHAPGFRDRILARHVMGPAAMERYDANYIGGHINGGAGDLRQFVARPTLGLHPWRTPVEGLYLCSSSTPPGPGVHGMCGWHAAHEVLAHAD